MIPPEVGIRDRDWDRARDPGRDAGLKIVKNGTRYRTWDRKLKNGEPGRDAGLKIRNHPGHESRGTEKSGTVPGTEKSGTRVPGTENFPGQCPGPMPTSGLD